MANVACATRTRWIGLLRLFADDFPARDPPGTLTDPDTYEKKQEE
jgi:hypothetical protein